MRPNLAQLFGGGAPQSGRPALVVVAWLSWVAEVFSSPGEAARWRNQSSSFIFAAIVTWILAGRSGFDLAGQRNSRRHPGDGLADVPFRGAGLVTCRRSDASRSLVAASSAGQRGIVEAHGRRHGLRDAAWAPRHMRFTLPRDRAGTRFDLGLRNPETTEHRNFGKVSDECKDRCCN
jgi:hypothetical protein